MFQEGAVPGRVDAFMYGAEAEDFSKDATELDTWVFERVEQLFESAASDPELDARLRQDKNVFFLHLLGLDTTGHSYRPYSREYLHNIKIVDQGVEKITALIDNFYADDKTAYVFTADHGMSDWGSHGDGHPDNTRTPLIAWGSGVAKPVTVSSGTASGHHDRFSSDWHLDHVQRNDVAQADIAALMAYLAGLSFPVNSVGELPLAYLSADQQTKAQAMLVNAQEILEMYRIKEHQKKNTVLRYKPFPGFSDDQHSPDRRVDDIKNTIGEGRHEKAITDSDALMKLGLQGLRYLQTYDWLFLRALVTVGYLGWMAFAFTFALDQHVFDGKIDATRTTTSTTVFSSIFVALLAFLLVQSSPWTYYAYAFFPVMFWEEVFARRQALAQGQALLSKQLSRKDVLGLVFNLFVFIGVLEIMVGCTYIIVIKRRLTTTGSKLLPPTDVHTLLPFGHCVACIVWNGLCAQQPAYIGYLGTRMRFHERIHSDARCQSRGHQTNVCWAEYRSQ